MSHTGRVNASLQVIVPIRLVPSSGPALTLDAALDTGFTGFVALPADVIARLGADFDSLGSARLADGNVVRVRRFRVAIAWMGLERNVAALEANGGPLIGMSLLLGSDVALQARIGGDVVIRPSASGQPPAVR